MPNTLAENFHRSVSAEMGRMARHGHTPEADSEQSLDSLLALGYGYLVDGHTVKGAAMILAARRWIANNGHINSMQRDIAKFMSACDQEVRKYPGIPSDKVKELRIRLMVEEMMGSTTPNNASGLILNKSDELVQSILNDDIVGIADGIADVLYVVIGTAVAYGINIQEVFDEVQRSNMSKTLYDEETETYTTLKDEGGKVIKPPSFSPADLKPIVDRQIALGRYDEEQAALLADIPEGYELLVVEVPENV